MVCFNSIQPKYTSALLFSGINPSSERHREIFVGCWSLTTSMAGRSHCNYPRLNNLLWWHSKLNIKKWNAILYKTNTYIFALRKTTQLTVNNIFISILFDFRIWIIYNSVLATWVAHAADVIQSWTRLWSVLFIAFYWILNFSISLCRKRKSVSRGSNLLLKTEGPGHLTHKTERFCLN